jgi:hypothetical protein
MIDAIMTMPIAEKKPSFIVGGSYIDLELFFLLLFVVDLARRSSVITTTHNFYDTTNKKLLV